MNPQKFVKAYQYIHKIFDKAGATNVNWVWSLLYKSYPDTSNNDYIKAYPGNKYVDWICITAYNPDTEWKEFDELISDVYTRLLKNIADKPIMIKVDCAENNKKDKASWIINMWKVLKEKYLAVKSIIWVNKNN